MPRKIIEPGKWWRVQVRSFNRWWLVANVLTIKNGRQAGYRGWQRRTRRRNWSVTLDYVRRQWDLRVPHEKFVGGYQFGELSDARRSANCIKIRDWCLRQTDGWIVEIVEFDGCRRNNIVTTKRVVSRKFSSHINEMERLAVEFVLGENAGNVPRPRRREGQKEVTHERQAGQRDGSTRASFVVGA